MDLRASREAERRDGGLGDWELLRPRPPQDLGILNLWVRQELMDSLEGPKEPNPEKEEEPKECY